jgi:type I restriction enzyme S subunit
LATGSVQDESLTFEYVSYDNKPSRADIEVAEGDIIFARMKGTNKVLYIDKTLDGVIVSTGFSVHRPDKKKIVPEFLMQFLKNQLFQDNKDKYCTGSTQAAITNEGLKKIQIPLPELDDQIRIADILSRAESLIAKRKETIKMLDEYLKSVFLDMFGDRSNLSKLQIHKLGDYILFLTSGSRGWAKYYAEAGDMFLRINNVRDAYLKLEDIIYVNPPNTAETIRTKVKANDLLLSITADLGRTAVVPQNLEGAFVNQHLAIIRLDNKRINPVFAAWFYAMPYGKSIVMRKNRNAVKAGLNFDDIKDFDIISPSLKQQNKFARIVDKVQGVKRRYIENLQFLEQLDKTLSKITFGVKTQ